MGLISRRHTLALAAGMVCTPAQALPAAERSVAFQVWRNGARIGDHAVTFSATGDRLVAAITARMRVKLGPVPLFSYAHEATETWEGGRFASLVSRSVSNGKVETVDARREGAELVIARAAGAPLSASAAYRPLTHWNREVLEGPLFNPQTGALIRCNVKPLGPGTVRYADGRAVSASGFAITGDAVITDWYDDAGSWAALKARAPDGSTIEYRRV